MTGLEPVRFAFEGTQAHAWVGGAPSGLPLLLLHGSGPGASSIGNWRTVLPALAARHPIVALDLIGFGESARPPGLRFDFERLLRQARHARASLLGAAPCGIIGHSVSAALALRLAAEDASVRAVLTTGAMGPDMPVNPELDFVWRCPRSREGMRAAAATLIHDPALIDEPYLDARMAVIAAPGYADYFDAMFDAPFDRIIASTAVPDAALAALEARVMMLHGRDDRPFPAAETTLRIAPRIPRADVVLLANCGHSVALERRDAFLAAAHQLFEPEA